MSAALLRGLGTSDRLSAVFSDASIVEAMVAFEVALARAEARSGVIPDAVAASIEKAARNGTFDVATLVEGQRRSGTPVIAFVDALTMAVRASDRESAGYVHWGVTSQDVSDTALVLCLRRAFGILAADHAALVARLRELSDEHASTPMLARTLLQPAPPTTFGLKAAGWAGEIARSWTRVSAAFETAFVLQFGGAAGTLAALGPAAGAVTSALARELELAEPGAPWHAHRDRLAGIVTACGIYTGALGKLARDVSLLMQHEVAEAFETGGGSSTMPHKRNPAGSAAVLAASVRMPGLVASFLSALVQEHERAAGGWHAEAPIVADVVETTGAALEAALGVVRGLTVDAGRMRTNIEATNGAVFAERAMMLAAAALGRDTAHKLVAEAVRASQQTGERLSLVISRMPELAQAIGSTALAGLEEPGAYLGFAEVFRRRLLDETS